MKAIGRSDACMACTCAHCLAEAEQCYGRGSPQQAAACLDTMKCVLDTKCQGLDCYCGTSTFITGCLSPNGPCRDQVLAAAEGPVLATTIVGRAEGSDYALGRARILGECGYNHCATECGIQTPP